MASWPQLPRPDQKFPAPTRARPAGARRIPAQIRRVGAGGTSRGVPTPVPCVCLLVLLTRPDPSGSAEPARLCRGCSHPSRRPPGQAASSFTPPLRRQGDEGLSPPFDPTAPRGAPESEPEPISTIDSEESPRSLTRAAGFLAGADPAAVDPAVQGDGRHGELGGQVVQPPLVGPGFLAGRWGDAVAGEGPVAHAWREGQLRVLPVFCRCSAWCRRRVNTDPLAAAES